MNGELETKIGERGCGRRQEGGLYACVPTTPYGVPIEEFLVDPPQRWKGGQLRAPMIVSSIDEDYANVIIGIGEEHYPYVPDYIEEAKVMGISKRFPREFPIERLDRGKSRMYLVHPNGIPKFPFDLYQKCTCGHPFAEHTYVKHPELDVVDIKCGQCGRCWDTMYIGNSPCRKGVAHRKGQPCIFELWPLSALFSSKKHTVKTDTSGAMIMIPSRNYTVILPQYPQFEPERGYDPAVFMSVPIHHFEFINQDNEAPKELVERFETTEWEMVICKE